MPVATTAVSQAAERHALHRAFLLDLIQRDERSRALARGWRHDDLQQLAETAMEHLAELVARTEDPPDNVVPFPGIVAATSLLRYDRPDRPRPPNATTLPLGGFADRLLAGEAMVDELVALLREAEDLPVPGVDRAARSDATATGTVALRTDSALRAMRSPLEAALRDIDQWWPTEARLAEAGALIVELGLGRWPVLAADLIRRYVAELEAIIHGREPRPERRTGDSDIAADELPSLDIPAFEASGDPATDIARLTKWQARFDEVRLALAGALDDGSTAAGRSRQVRRNEVEGYRRDTRWLFEHQAGISSFRAISDRELGSAERWREVKKAVMRVKASLDLAESSGPPATN